MDYKAFGQCLLYDEMSEGETYYTAAQRKVIAELIADVCDQHELPMQALRVIRRNVAEMRWDSTATFPFSNLIFGILLCASRTMGVAWPDGAPQDYEAQTELANSFWRAIDE